MDKIMLVAVLFVVGWLWSYLFLRQFIFNFAVALPIIKGMEASSKELIAPTARKFLCVSVIVNLLVCAIGLLLVIRFCPTYLIISFISGALIAFAFYIKKVSFKNKEMFESFCGTYYRFVIDDELRTLMFNKKYSQMKVRLHAMELDYSFIPKFTEE